MTVWSLLNPLSKDPLLPWSRLLMTLLQKLLRALLPRTLRTLPPRMLRTLQYSFNLLTFLYPILFSDDVKCPFFVFRLCCKHFFLIYGIGLILCYVLILILRYAYVHPPLCIHVRMYLSPKGLGE